LTNQIPQNDSGDVSFDGAAAPGQGESGADGVVVGEETGGESAQGWNAAGLSGCDPGVEVMALTLTGHSGEVADQVVDRAQGLASVEYAAQL
jgi:hypothetical protein